MSPMTRILYGVGLALVLLACSVDAHGWMTSPKPRGQYLSPAKYEYLEYAPASTDPTDSAIACRNDAAMPKASWIPLQAGKSQSITIQFNVLHVGECAVYLTYDGDKTESEMKWFKIWEQLSCKDKSQYDITIPSYLPSGDHVIFRWEWYALHAYPTVEYYAQCVDAVMTGSASGALPSPQVNIPGHLPKLTGEVSLSTNNYWWPWGGQTEFFTGPVLATLNGQSTTTGSSTATKAPTTAPAATKAPTTAPAATKAPTNAPAATKAPTNAPAATKAPTNAPAATKAPTNAPAATKAPTKAPAATKAPTRGPTTKPTTRPPTQSTTKPISTTSPTTKPPSQSVKLSVSNSASTWWFAASVAGHRATEVSSVEFKDSGCYSDYTSMTNDWGDMWVYTPTSSAITFPVTVKASLPSGSSLTFIVNSLPATTVDSGAIFQ